MCKRPARNEWRVATQKQVARKDDGARWVGKTSGADVISLIPRRISRLGSRHRSASQWPRVIPGESRAQLPSCRGLPPATSSKVSFPDL